MQHLPRVSHRRQKGFTFVEVAVVAPIVILLISSFITVIVGMTREVLQSRASSQLAYEVQDTLNRIDSDIKLSIGFLAQNNVTLVSPQGYDGATDTFDNVSSGSKGPMLVLNMLATTGNPLSSSSSVAYLSNKPNACGNLQGQNTPLTFNIVYFVKNNSLWRRTVMPSNYASAACNVNGSGTAAPWQIPSCAVGYSDPFCKTEDEQVVSGVGISDFNIAYYNAATSTTANSTASDANASTSSRNAALRTATTASISVNATKTIAGKDVSQSSTLRSTRLDVNASTIADPVIVSTPSTPVVTGTITPPNSAVFSWPTSTGNGTITYSLDYCIGATATCTSSGPWTSGLTNSTNTSYTLNTVQGNIVNVRVRASNTAGTSSYGTTTVTVPLWATPVFQSYWANYGGSYAPGRYTKTSEGVVVLSGLLKRNGSPAGGEIIFQLPPEYRPSALLIFTTITNANVASRVDVDASGYVKILSGDGGYLSLDGIKFVANATPGISFQSMTLSNSWVNYGAPHQTAQYAKDSLNRTFTTGLIKNGSTTAASLITALPSGFPSVEYLHIPNYNASGFGFFSPSQTNATYAAGAGLQYKGGGNGYFSIESMFYNDYTGFTTFTYPSPTGWTWYSAAGIFPKPGYKKATDGLVTLKGLVMSGTATSDTTMFTLPAGYRPSARMIFEVVNNSGVGRVDVLPTGEVRILTGGNVWLALDNISFMAEQ